MVDFVTFYAVVAVKDDTNREEIFKNLTDWHSSICNSQEEAIEMAEKWIRDKVHPTAPNVAIVPLTCATHMVRRVAFHAPLLERIDTI